MGSKTFGSGLAREEVAKDEEVDRCRCGCGGGGGGGGKAKDSLVGDW